MRVALISITESMPGPEDDGRRGLLRFAGRSLAAHQISLALAMNCERIICMTRGIPPGHFELQQVSEAGQAQFHLVEAITQLSGLVRAADELFVFAEGVLLPEGPVVHALDARSGVLTIPANRGVPAGFERLDAELAWAGALRSSGSVVARLADLPSDVEPVSALLRIALQSDVSPVHLPDNLLDDGTLVLFDNQTQVARAQEGWLRRAIKPRSWFAPGLALGDRIVARLAARLLALDPQGWRSAAITAVCALLALITAAFVSAALAYLLLVPAGFSAVAAWRLSEITAPVSDRRHFDPGRSARWIINATTVAIPLVAALPELSFDTAFAIVVLVGMLSLAERLLVLPRLAIFGDRIALSVLLAVFSAADWLIPAVQALSIAVLLALLGTMRSAQR